MTAPTRSLRLALALVLLTSLLSMAQAQPSGSLLLKVDLKGKHTPHSGSSSSEVHHRWLDITANPLRLDSTTSVDIEWTLFADDLKSGSIVPQAHKTQQVSISPGQPVHLVSDDTVFTYVREHGEKTSGSRHSRYKKVEATGHQYHGWAVRALVGGEVVAELYSHPALSRNIKDSPGD